MIRPRRGTLTVHKNECESRVGSRICVPEMTSFEKVFARICLERGWAGRSQLAEAVRARSQDPASASMSLSSLLVSRGVLTQEQAGILQSEAADVTKSAPYAEVREDDTWIGQLLVEAGSVTEQQVKQALAVQADCAA